MNNNREAVNLCQTFHHGALYHFYSCLTSRKSEPPSNSQVSVPRLLPASPCLHLTSMKPSQWTHMCGRLRFATMCPSLKGKVLQRRSTLTWQRPSPVDLDPTQDGGSQGTLGHPHTLVHNIQVMSRNPGKKFILPFMWHGSCCLFTQPCFSDV